MNRSQSTLYYYGDDSLLAQLKAGKLNISQDWSMLEPYISFDRWHEGNVQIITEQELLAGLRFEFEKLPENIQQLLPFDDFLKRDQEFLLIVDQTTNRGQFAAGAGEFADIPGVLGKEVVGALAGRADEVLAVGRLGGLEAVEATESELSVTGVDQGTHL